MTENVIFGVKTQKTAFSWFCRVFFAVKIENFILSDAAQWVKLPTTQNIQGVHSEEIEGIETYYYWSGTQSVTPRRHWKIQVSRVLERAEWEQQGFFLKD